MTSAVGSALLLAELPGGMTGEQVRSIGIVTTAVAKGDLSKKIDVDVKGEILALKDTINEMIRNLKEQTLKNAEQDWLKTNLARFTNMLQGQRDLATVGRLLLTHIPPWTSREDVISGAKARNPAAAMAGKVTIVEVEEIVEVANSTPTASTCPASM